MGFTGTPIFVPGPAVRRPTQPPATIGSLVILGLGLAANIGPPDPTLVAADTGEFTTSQTPTPGQTSLPANFGRGPGRWSAADLAVLIFAAQDANTAVQGASGQTSIVYHPSFPNPLRPRVVAGDIIFTWHNRGLQPSLLPSGGVLFRAIFLAPWPQV